MSEVGKSGKMKLPITNQPPKQDKVTQNNETKVVEGGEKSEEVKKESVKSAPSFSRAKEVDGTIKIDLSSKNNKTESDEDEKEVQSESQDKEGDEGEQEEVLERITNESSKDDDSDSSDSIIEKVQASNEANTKDGKQSEPAEEKVQEAKAESEESKVELPENIQKVVDFMNETGGSLEDYVRLNSEVTNDEEALRQYYKSINPSLSDEDIAFKIEDNFSYDEDIDEERDIKRKKLRYKEEVSKAKAHVEGLKEKYYDEVKLGSKLPPETKQAVEFYNSYKEEQETVNKGRDNFRKKTNEFFNQDFKGFDFKVGEDTFRYKVKDASKVAEKQIDINNIYGKYFDEKTGELKDPSGYHKASFAAQDPDGLAEHFYNQGRAEAIKELNANPKNLDMGGRKDHNSSVKVGKTTIKLVDGETPSKFKLNLKQSRGRR